MPVTDPPLSSVLSKCMSVYIAYTEQRKCGCILAFRKYETGRIEQELDDTHRCSACASIHDNCDDLYKQIFHLQDELSEKMNCLMEAKKQLESNRTKGVVCRNSRGAVCW
jgi:hypothetical protein